MNPKLRTTDAAIWAKEFMNTFPNAGVDEGTMIGWFANAIEMTKDLERERNQKAWEEMEDLTLRNL